MTTVPEKKPFPEANVDKELNPGHNKTVEADSTSSQIAANKEKAEANKKKRSSEKKRGEGGPDGLKTTVIMSVIFAAVAGAAFGIAKMLRERR